MLNTSSSSSSTTSRTHDEDGLDRIGSNHRLGLESLFHIYGQLFKRWKVVHLLLWIVRSLARFVRTLMLDVDGEVISLRARERSKLNFCFSFPLRLKSSPTVENDRYFTITFPINHRALDYLYERRNRSLANLSPFSRERALI